MNHRDEEIIANRQAMQQQQKKEMEQEEIEREKEESIFDGRIHLLGKEVAFERRTFEEYGISLLLPERFEEMEQDIKDAIYPYGKAPKHAFAGEDIPFQVTLNQTENIVPDEGMPKFMGIAKEVMERIGPQAKIFSSICIQKENIEKKMKNIGIMEIATKGADGPVFNTQFYISSREQKMIIGGITCQGKRHDRMVPVMKEIIDSIEILY